MRRVNLRQNRHSKKGITLVELIISMTLTAMFAVVCVAIMNPISRMYKGTVKITRAQLLADAIIDSIRKECDGLKTDESTTVWIAQLNETAEDDKALRLNGPEKKAPGGNGNTLVIQKNNNYAEAIYACLPISKGNYDAVHDNPVQGTKSAHSIDRLSAGNLYDPDEPNVKKGIVHFGYYQAKEDKEGIFPYRAYDYTNPVLASAYGDFTVKLEFKDLKLKEDKYPTYCMCVVTVNENGKKVYSRTTVITFSANGSGQGHGGGGGGGGHSDNTKNVDVTIRWLDSDGSTITWPSGESITITLTGTNPQRSKTLTEGQTRFSFANVKLNGKPKLTATKVDGFEDPKVTGNSDSGYYVTYKREDVETVKLINGEQFVNKLGKDSVTGIVFGKKSEWVSQINGFKAQGAKVEGPTNVAVPYGDPYNSTNTRDDYVLYKVTMNGVLTDYVLSKSGKFVLNESCKSMFANCKQLKTITGFTGPSFSSVFSNKLTTDMSSMFESCEKIEIFRLAGLVTSKVTNTSAMFKKCKSVNSYDFSEWNTSGITNMSYMFNDFQMSKTDFSLDISHFKFSQTHEINMSYMFDSCGAATIVFPQMNNSDKTKKISNINYMFNNCKNLTAITNILVNKESAGDSALSSAPHVCFDGVTSLTHLFGGCTKFKNVKLWISMSGCSSIENLFSDCTNLNTLDLSESNFYSLEKMTYFIYNSEGLTKVKINNASFHKYTGTPINNKVPSFEKCNGLEHLEMKNTDLSSVTNALFIGRRSIKHLDLSGSVMTSYTEVNKLLAYTNQEFNLEYIDFTGTQFGNYTSAYQMFMRCKNIQKVKGFRFPSNSKEVFKSCNLTTKITLENCSASANTNVSSMFFECTNLKTVDLNTFDTSNVINMSKMFQGCSVLCFDSSSWTKWDTSHVTDMSYMFKDCCYDSQKSNDPALREGNYYINISNFNFSSVTNMSYMFSCGTVKNVDHVYDILDTVIMPDGTNDNGNAANVTNTICIFMWRGNLTEIRNLEYFKTSEKLKTAKSMFSRANVTVLDIRGFDFSHLDNNDNGSSWIFDKCPSLVTIYADPDKNYIPAKGGGMFTECSNIVGGAGTTFRGDSKNYAKIDGGPGNEGYFTDYHERTP